MDLFCLKNFPQNNVTERSLAAGMVGGNSSVWWRDCSEVQFWLE